MKTWITWECEGAAGSRVELPAEVAETIERYAAEIAVSAADVAASLVSGLAGEIRNRPAPNCEAEAAALLALLDRGSVMITVRPQAPGVELPEALSGAPLVSLRFGYRLTPPILGLEVDAAGVRGTLTFGGRPYHCVIPWPAMVVAVLEHAPVPSGPAAPARPKLRLV